MTDLMEIDGDAIPRWILDSMGEGVVIADRGGKLVFGNAAAERIVGQAFSNKTSDEWVESYGIFAADGLTPMPTNELPSVKALRGEPSSSAELVIRNAQVPAGIVVLATARPLRSPSADIVGAITVFRDLTELRRTQGQLERALDELCATKGRQADLTAFLVHDLKNPLSVILSYAQILLDEEGRSASDAEALVDVRQAATHMHRMVMDMLDVGAGDDGALPVTRSEVDVAVLLEDLRRAMQGGATGRGVTLRVLPVAAGARLAADPELLRRVLQNLVDNCLKYGPRGAPIEIEARDAGDSLELRVADEGPGVPSELRERIFDKYAIVERDTGRTRDSRGIGLRFCRVAVDAHGGRIWVEDRVPHGACFVVRLPKG